ncbi:hypothetical protein MRS44_003799 [Fusarium solani]|uniref:uncharacterized protein n=1 Tax=Fusarium solani TaxID=169388 RepID=UPI0032C454B3|nr:hypothetical protein MRS44_003799 [Fusarium solani]
MHDFSAIARVQVFATLCKAIDEATKQFTTGPAYHAAKEFSETFLEHWNNTLNGEPSATVAEAQTRLKSNTYADFLRRPAHGAQRDPENTQPRTRQPKQKQQCAPEVPTDDIRVFIPLDPDSPAWGNEPFAIRTFVAEHCNLTIGKIPQATRTKTGWAVRPVDVTTRDHILTKASTIGANLGADKVEPMVKWHTYVVQDCPTGFQSLGGERVDLIERIQEEVQAQTGLKPVKCHPTKKSLTATGLANVVIAFDQKPKSRFCLFGTSKLARPITKVSKPKQCANCWDFHTQLNCTRITKCRICGRNGHDAETCPNPERIQCANCAAPHAADYNKCPGRPRRTPQGTTRRLTKREDAGPPGRREAVPTSQPSGATIDSEP